jgi:hypothetical protein
MRLAAGNYPWRPGDVFQPPNVFLDNHCRTTKLHVYSDSWWLSECISQESFFVYIRRPTTHLNLHSNNFSSSHLLFNNTFTSNQVFRFSFKTKMIASTAIFTSVVALIAAAMPQGANGAPAANPVANPGTSAPTTQNIQPFSGSSRIFHSPLSDVSGTQGGSAPSITYSGDSSKPFLVDGTTFTDFISAVGRPSSHANFQVPSLLRRPGLRLPCG